MPDTFEAIAVTAIALLPGALTIWAFERTAGRWTTEVSDRILRFAGVSAVYLALLAPLAYYLYSTKIRTGYIRSGGPLSWWFWIGCLGYVLLPYAIGRFAGAGAKNGWTWLQYIIGRQPVPRAWDYTFLHGKDGWIRLRLKSTEEWIIGAWARLEDGRESFASPFPQPEALYLVRTVECDPRSGRFIYDAEGQPILRQEAILVRWDEVQYLEFIDG
jgi:hypothetical protein